MNELERSFVADSAAASPANILSGLSAEAAHALPAGAPHSIYAELWHIAFWQQVSLDWLAGLETPVPQHAGLGFPAADGTESWDALCARFFATLAQVAAHARDRSRWEKPIRCTAPAGRPVRVMTAREQLESMTAHNAYHFGRIVLLRQLLGLWPPAGGGFTW